MAAEQRIQIFIQRQRTGVPFGFSGITEYLINGIKEDEDTMAGFNRFFGSIAQKLTDIFLAGEFEDRAEALFKRLLGKLRTGERDHGIFRLNQLFRPMTKLGGLTLSGFT